ncbi:MAG: acetyl-CoA carboxylase, biotin carboxyl carrier protein, partial [Thermoplasmata archaeon]
MDKMFIFELIEKVKDSKIQELELTTSDGKILIRQYQGPKEVYVSGQPLATAITASSQVEQQQTGQSVNIEATSSQKESKYHVIKSPL